MIVCSFPALSRMWRCTRAAMLVVPMSKFAFFCGHIYNCTCLIFDILGPDYKQMLHVVYSGSLSLWLLRNGDQFKIYFRRKNISVTTCVLGEGGGGIEILLVYRGGGGGEPLNTICIQGEWGWGGDNWDTTCVQGPSKWVPGWIWSITYNIKMEL